MAYDRTKLTDEQVNAFLAEHPKWRREGDELIRTYEFPTFLGGIAFVQKVAEQAEKDDHHPDIDIRWRKVTLKLTTHDAGGLTFRDTKAAAAADQASGL